MKPQMDLEEQRTGQVQRMETTEMLAAGRGIREALRRQTERAERTELSDDFEDQVMNRIEAVGSTKGVGWQLRRMAAIWLALCLMGGLSYAAYHAVKGHWFGREQVARPDGAAQVVPMPKAAAGQVVRFANQPLDSILLEVGAHYRRTVVFRDETSRAQRLLISWNVAAPLSDFLEILNELDGLRITDVRDTLFVESVAEEDEEE